MQPKIIANKTSPKFLIRNFDRFVIDWLFIGVPPNISYIMSRCEFTARSHGDPNYDNLQRGRSCSRSSLKWKKKKSRHCCDNDNKKKKTPKSYHDYANLFSSSPYREVQKSRVANFFFFKFTKIFSEILTKKRIFDVSISDLPSSSITWRKKKKK